MLGDCWGLQCWLLHLVFPRSPYPGGKEQKVVEVQNHVEVQKVVQVEVQKVVQLGKVLQG